MFFVTEYSPPFAHTKGYVIRYEYFQKRFCSCRRKWRFRQFCRYINYLFFLYISRALSLPISSSVIHIVFFILFYITSLLQNKLFNVHVHTFVIYQWRGHRCWPLSAVGPEEWWGTLGGGGILLEIVIPPGVWKLTGEGGGGFVPGGIGSCG